MFDDIDHRILAQLQRDSDISLSDLADMAGISKNPCWRRVKRLEEAGVIRGRVALLDPKRLNVGQTVFIAVRTDQHTADWLTRFRAAVQDIPEIVGVYRLAGDIDYLIHAVVPDVAAYDALYQHIIGRVTLSDVSASFVMEDIKRTTALPLTYV